MLFYYHNLRCYVIIIPTSAYWLVARVMGVAYKNLSMKSDFSQMRPSWSGFDAESGAFCGDLILNEFKQIGSSDVWFWMFSVLLLLFLLFVCVCGSNGATDVWKIAAFNLHPMCFRMISCNLRTVCSSIFCIMDLIIWSIPCFLHFSYILFRAASFDYFRNGQWTQIINYNRH